MRVGPPSVWIQIPLLMTEPQSYGALSSSRFQKSQVKNNSRLSPMPTSRVLESVMERRKAVCNMGKECHSSLHLTTGKCNTGAFMVTMKKIPKKRSIDQYFGPEKLKEAGLLTVSSKGITGGVRTINFIILLLLLSLNVEAKAEIKLNGTIGILETQFNSLACKCSHEDVDSIKVIKVVKGNTERDYLLQSPHPGFNIGDVVVFGCDVTAEDRGLTYFMEPKSLAVYPSVNRTCQNNCVLSGHPPVCLISSKPINLSDVPISDTLDCSTSDCLEFVKDWVEVGSLLPYRSKSTGERNYSRTFLFEFPRRMPLAFMTVGGSDESMLGKIEVQLKAESRTVVRNVDDASRSIIVTQYQNLTLQNRHSAVIKVSVYTRQMFVHITTETTLDWDPQIKFYTVPEIGMKGFKADKCLHPPPSIPNSHERMSTDEMSVEYICDPGYKLIDPLLNKPFTGNVSCHNGFEWSPTIHSQSLPICQQEDWYSDSSDSPEGLPTSSSFNHSGYDKPERYPTLSIVVDRDEGLTEGRVFLLAVCMVVLLSIPSLFLLFHCWSRKRPQKNFFSFPCQKTEQSDNKPIGHTDDEREAEKEQLF